MSQPHSQERVIMAWSAALAAVGLCALFVASMSNVNLLASVIAQGVFLPILAVVFVVRFIIAVVAFFGAGRPPATRSFRAMFWRDKWLADRIRSSQPRTVLAVGASIIFFKLGLLVTLPVAALCVFLHLMSLAQAASIFAVGVFFSIGYQAVCGSFLLIRQWNKAPVDWHN